MTRCDRALGAARVLVAAVAVLGLVAAPLVAGEITFEDVTVPSGVITLGDNHDEIHGAAWGDVTGNGFPDLFLGMFDGTPNRLLLNQDDGAGGRVFVESFQTPINVGDMHVSGAAFADFNNSGHLDLIIGNSYHGTNAPGTTRILENDGSGNFTERTAGSGLEIPNFGAITPFTADFSGDGRLDVFLEHTLFRGSQESRMLYNTGDFTFNDVTESAGFTLDILGMGGAVGDFTGNNAPDLIITGPTPGNHLVTNNRLFLNNADGTFTEYTNNSALNDPDHWNTSNTGDWPVGAAVGDLNNNGRLDLVISHQFNSTMENAMEPKAVHVYLNQGVDANGEPIFEFANVELEIPGFHTRITHAEIRDMDNDGFPDIVLSAGMSHDDHPGEQHPVVLRNLLGDTGELKFTTVAGQDPDTFSGPYGSGNRWFNDPEIDPMYWPGAPMADYDRDGRIDLFGMEAIHEDVRPSRLFRNVTDNDNRFVQIMVDASKLEDVNNQGIGSRVMLFEGGKAHDLDALLGMTEIHITNGFSSGVEAMAHFGAGLRDVVDVVIELPYGVETWTIEWLPTNSFYIASGSAVIPEPSTAALLALAGLGLLARRRRPAPPLAA